MYLYYNIKQTGKSSSHRGNAKDWSYMLTNVFILKNKTKKQRRRETCSNNLNVVLEVLQIMSP